ncbi:response regulator [Chitinophaga tropicalis]|uniref:histidine kinase n=1 Tax=Chitinophaga tropicalis TaxID=2683588 RepID=A0A7K1U8D4_9BACT|nr:response regulator [Chitinophaga tropicalis]MVT10634.1 response regulator [Chitinophaga tropicalis]
MRKTIKLRLYLGFALAIILIIAGGVGSYFAFNRQHTEAQWVAHSYQVITNAQMLNRYIYQMESAEKAYRATRREEQLALYFQTEPRVMPLIGDIKKLVADNPKQFQQMLQVENRIIDVLRYWETISTQNQQDYVFSHSLEIAQEERRLLDTVHAGILKFNTTEHNLLAERRAKTGESVTNTETMLILNNILILIIALALMIVSFRELRSRVKAEGKLSIRLADVTRLQAAQEEKNRILTGVSRINESLRADTDLAALSRQTLLAFISCLDIPAGAFYSYDELKNELYFVTGIAVPNAGKQRYALGEGLIGHAAQQQEITVLKQVPANYWQISSGSGQVKPGSVVFVPLRHDNTLAGVLELVLFGDVPPLMKELLDKTADAIAIAFNAATARARVMELLKRVQEQKEILETQQEELRQSNDELTRQSEVLQASEEELRVQEEELRQINDEMNAQNTALEITRRELSLKAEELEQSSKYKSEFLANMSHELRTPLNSVLILARLLQENKNNNLTPKQIEYAATIHRSGSDLLQLINDILDLSKIEAGKIDMHMEQVAVRSMISDLQQLFHVVAEEKGIHFVAGTENNVPEKIHTDRQRLEQILKNLLSNAFKFTPRDGTIKLHWNIKPDGLHISVSDTGTGIPADKQQLIFEAFRQADGSTSRKYGGTGLGLSISRELVKRLGGEIRLVSEEGIGSTFTVVLKTDTPVISAPASVIEEPVHNITTTIPVPELLPVAEQIVADDRETLSKQDRLILIIEDDAGFASILRDFAREKGYKTIVALNGNDGLFFARKYLPDAIMLDMNLPLIDGNNILKILKSNEELKHILVHVISAGEISVLVRDKVEGYTQKPLQVTDLESVFTSISDQLQARFKKVLVISDGILLQHPYLQSLSDERHMQTQYHPVPDIDAAAVQLQEKNYDGIILDVNRDVENGIGNLHRLRQLSGNKELPIIVYLDHDISEADELHLKKEAAAIVRNSTFSTDRLMDELELFLYKLKETEKPPHTGKAVVTGSRLEGQKVLLADDDMRNVFSLSAVLGEEGIDVITAADGKEALGRLEEHTDIRLVLMDIMMPGMDGYEAMKHIRANSRFKQLPVIALTAKAMAGDREKCIAAGASDYIAKPVDSSKLLSLMRVWMV